MSTHPFMRLWVGDFIKDTLELDAKEVGAYMLLLMAMWERGGSLPADHSKLRRVARVGRDWPKVWEAIGGYFTQSEGRLTQRRLTEELTYVRTKSTVAAQSGRLGGRAKALKSHKQDLANAKRPLSYPESESDREDTNVSSTRKRKSRISETAEITDGMRRAAGKRALSKQEAEAQFERFKNNALAKGLTYVDWDRAFVTWLDSPYFKLITSKEKSNDGQAADRAARAGERFRARHMDSGQGANAAIALFPDQRTGGAD